MISFSVSLVALILGYLLYGRFVERVFGPDDRTTPAVAKADGLDFMVLPNWKVFMIQFLNIAGTGPIFGAIMGAKFGPVAYLWIVFGCIFAGATHDYLCGMLSMRHDGASLPEMVGKYLGKTTKNVTLVFTVLLLIMVGTVFVYSPAEILHTLGGDVLMWVIIIFAYYIIATMLPIDKIIGKIYPLFALSLLFMAGALMVVLYVNWPQLPELWSHLYNMGMGRPIFYGAMITEGIVALIWATVSSWFFYGAPTPGYELIAGADKGFYTSAPAVVNLVCRDWLGVVGAVLAMLGVVAAPITSGDTAFRSARLIVAEWLKWNQRPIAKRLYICIPLFACSLSMLYWQMENPDGFNTIWQYFGWSNQALTVFVLWTLTVYLVRQKKPFFITLIPALFMTTVCSTFLFVSKQAFGLPGEIGYPCGAVCFVIACVWFTMWYRKYQQSIK